MVSPILVTKLFNPVARPEFVSRPRLIEQLNGGLHRKLTLISAPAGFGKTTLVTEWLDHLRGDAHQEESTKNRIAWLSLDNGDKDPARFLTYFIAALNRIEEIESTFGSGSLSMLQSPQPPPIEAILTPLINEIAGLTSTTRIIFVLDDYHLVDTSLIQDILNFILENLPPQLHLVITTREDPLLPLPRLRTREQLTEVRAAELRFKSPEAAEFLNQVMGLDLSINDIAALEARTEGWIAGLQLAAISLKGHSDTSRLIQAFTGSNRLVLDYLVDEVLNQQPEDIQSFLLQTAILDRLTESLCDAVTGQKNGQVILEMLERANLFIVPLDDERCWYRYHHLFAELLRKRSSHTQPELPSILHRRASNWYEQNGFDDEAIEHALSGDDFDHAAEIIEKHIDDIWGAGHHAVIQRWVADLPDTLVFSKPHLCIFHAWYLFVNGQRDAAEQALQAAEQVLQDQDTISGSDRARLLGRAAAVRAFMTSYQGDLEGIIQHAHEAYEYLPNQDLTWRCLNAFVLGDALLYKGEMAEAHRVRVEAVKVSEETGHYYLILIANLRLAETLKHQGKLKQVNELCKKQMQFVNEVGISQTVAAGWLLALWGDVMAEKNDLDAAITQALKGVEVAGRGRRDVSFFGWSNLYLLRVLFSRGDMLGAEEVIKKMQHIVRERDLPILAHKQLSAWQARFWLEQGKLETASWWVKEQKLHPDGEISFFNESQYVVFARILSAQGQTEQAIRLHHRLLDTAKAGGRTLRVIEILILQALAFQAKEDKDEAITTLEKVLALAEPEGFIRIFVDEGPPMAQLLYKTLSQGIAPDYVQRLLAAFPDIEPEQIAPSNPQNPESEWVEPLSERELDVLKLIAAGLTNQEIAARLYLSLNTVKAHARSIYSKLNVNSRTQAIARARTLGIIVK